MEERLKRVAAQREWNFNYKGNLNEIESSGVFLIVFPNKKIYIGSAIQIGLRINSILKNLVSKKKGWEFKAAQENSISKEYDWYRLREYTGLKISFCECEDFWEFEISLKKEIENWENYYNSFYLFKEEVKNLKKMEVLKWNL